MRPVQMLADFSAILLDIQREKIVKDMIMKVGTIATTVNTQIQY
jgi:hypothetical protein